jgi:hypothetical protein
MHWQVQDSFDRAEVGDALFLDPHPKIAVTKRSEWWYLPGNKYINREKGL